MNDYKQKQRIIVNQDQVHSVDESVYQEVENAATSGTILSYLTHPNKIIRLLAELKIKRLKGDK